jgi:hypothetical protein
MDETPILPGVFYSLIIAGCIVALPLAYILIAKYRKALIKGMGYVSASFVPRSVSVNAAESSFPVLPEINIVNISELSEDNSKIYLKLKETLGYHWFVYGAMVLVSATVISFSFLQVLDSISIWRLLYCILIFSFSYVHISGMLLTNGWKQKFGIYSIVFFVYLSLLYVIWDTAATNNMGFVDALAPVFYYNVIPTFIIILFRSGRIKAVGMFVLTFFIISLSGPQLFTYYLVTHPSVMEKLGYAFIDAGFSANNTVLTWVIVSVLLTMLVGWVFINRIKTFYTRKWINDIQLTADSYVLLFNITYSIFIFFDSPGFALISLLAFPAYKLTGFLLLYLIGIRKVKKVSPGLLLLRVFALGDDSRNLFERILKHWRYAGSIQMISGPDLATTTVEPHEIISFVSGKMKDSFCESEESINDNISKIDNIPDLDGTHRVNEFFCRDNNWKYVLQQLVVHSDIVLMDLRKFSEQFKGCRYEIEALVNLVPLDRIVFVIDDETVIPFAQRVFAGAFQLADKDSVNKVMPPPAITLYKIDKNKDKDVNKLMNLICSKIE